MLKSFLLFLISLCFVGRIYGFGHVDPETIYAFENELNATIDCSFNLAQGDGKTSSDLVFEETCNNSMVSYDTRSSNVEIISKNKIRIQLPNRPYSKCQYLCYLKDKHMSNVAFTNVFVGKRLSNVKNFKCRSKDWHNMSCEFIEMDNFIPLTYKLTYRFDNTHTRTCQLRNDSKRGRFCDVYTDRDTENNEHFFRSVDMFDFTLVSSYAEKTGLIGKHIENFKIDHLASVIPSGVENIKTEVGSNNVTVFYDVPSHYNNSRLRFDYEISVKSEYEDVWGKKEFLNVRPNETEQQLSLEYAFTVYNISIRRKSHKAPKHEDMYSPLTFTNLQTKAKSPDRPPNSTFGAFYIHDDDNLTIYWRELNRHEMNGPNFRYSISGSYHPKKLRNISADFSNLELTESMHSFDVWSENNEGKSASPLTIDIPKKNELLDVKISLIQIYNDSEYNLTWTCRGSKIHLIEYFNIFFCESDSGNPNTCKQQFDFTSVPKTKHSLMVPAEPKLIFAIAAYSKNRTTGMQWSECRANELNSIGIVLHAAIDRIAPKSLNLKWMVDCRDKSIVKFFNVTVCEGNDAVECKSFNVNKKEREYLIEGLRPFMLYKVLISMISMSGKLGLPFEIYEKTKEDAPSAPRNLTYSEITNSSVLLNWLEPETINGEIRHHRIEFFSNVNSTQEKQEKHIKDVEINSTSYVLDGLKSFTRYAIYIFACTVKCSKESSNIINFQTKIGVPETTSVPVIDYHNKIISWQKPHHFRGNLTFYELRIESKLKDQDEIVYHLKTQNCQLELELCARKINNVRVRAVNVIGPNLKHWTLVNHNENDTIDICRTDQDLIDFTGYELLPGEWSNTTYDCVFGSFTDASSILSICLILAVFFGILTVLYIGGKRINECSKLEVEVPETLKEIIDDSNTKKTDPLFKRLFSSRKLMKSPDIVFVQRPITTYDNSPEIIRDSVMEPLIDEIPQRNQSNENVQLLASQLPNLHQIDEVPEEELLIPIQSVSIVPTNNTSNPYIQMSALEKKSLPSPPVQDLTNTGEYLSIKRGFTQTNYVGNVVTQPTNRGLFIKEMLKISQEQQPSTETSFQQPVSHISSGYVQPGYTGKRRPSFRAKHLLTVIFTALLFKQSSCFNGNGVVYPERVVKLVNSSVDVICTIDLGQTGGRNSSHLSFEGQGKKIPQNQITILNSTSIKWHLERATENDTKRYQCLLDGEGVGVTNLYIGYHLSRVTDFKCRSDNWQNMTCQFTKPWNPIPTEYQLTYNTNIAPHYHYNCSLASHVKAFLECSIPYPSYRSTHELWKFFLTIRNELHSLNQSFEINNFAVIVPAPPENISFTEVTSESVVIHWKLSYKLELLHKNHAVNFVHDVRILSEFQNKNNNETVWEIIDPFRVKKETRNDQILWYYIELRHLKYANSWYDVRIRVRTDKAEDTEEMYSEVSGLGFRTEPRIPDRSPKVDQGAFFINDDNDVYIFWEELSKSERNGPNASYAITEVRENGKPVKRVPIEITNTMAKFGKIDPHNSYEFTIRSKNSLGTSEYGSLIRVPSKRERLPHPMNLKKISQDGVYNLSWQAPHRNHGYTYTVFWCKPKNSLPNACEGDFNFSRVDRSINSFSLIQNGSINFAVSTNNEISSSGMVWAMCTAAQSSDIGKIKTIWITQIDSSRMELQWKLDCMFDSIVKGYVIKYCPIKDPKTLECKEGSLKNITINHTANNYTITSLKPYTTYKIVLSMFSATRHGPDSDPLQNTTLEAKPSPPLEFKAYDVRNTSMKLEWRRPKHSNGVLMYYSIFYNGNRIDVYNVTNDTTKEPYEKMTYLLQNLTSFTNYELLIKACNQFCSENSNKDNKTTEIGVPGSMTQPSSITLANDSGQIQITWSPPRVKSGHINYYELKTVSKHRGMVMREITALIGSKHLSCRRASPCVPNIDTIEYYVRPVNVIRSPHANDETSTTQVTQKYHDTTHNNRVDTDLSASLGYYSEMASTAATKHPMRHHHQSCEENDTELLKWIAMDQYSEHLPGEWSKASITNCMHVGGVDAKTIVTIICSLFLMGTMLGVGYKFYQKIKDMKNIVIVLPPGLEDITKEIRPENLENSSIKKMSKPDIIMDNTVYADEEEDRLLRKRADTDSSGQSQSDESHSNIESHEDGVEEDNTCRQGLIDDGSQSSNHSISMDTEFQPTQEPSTSTPNQQLPPQYPPIMSSGYIKPNTMLRPNASGYVQHTAIPSSRPTQTTNNGYVPFNQVGRPVMNVIPPENTADLNNVKIGMKTPIVASTDANGISGYVTHKQLSDFGHRMQ